MTVLTKPFRQSDQPDDDVVSADAAAPAIRNETHFGFVGLLLILVASTMRGWPFHTLTAAPWFFQINGVSPLWRYSFLALFTIGVAMLCRAWWRLVRFAKAGAVSTKATVVIFAVWSLPIVLAAPLFSGDVYFYYVAGEGLLRGYSPYESGISAMGPASDVFVIHPLWRDTLSAYGPIFMRTAEAVVKLSGGSIIVGVLLFRFLTIAALLVMVASIVSLSKRFNRKPAEGIVIALLNPITMLHLVGGAHNDAVMVGFLFAAFAIGLGSTRWHWRLVALLLCVCGASFKIPAMAGALVLGWIWAGGATATASYVRRCVAAAVAGVVSVVLFELVTLITGIGWGWTHALGVPGLAHPLLAPANAVAMSIGGLFGVPYGFNRVTRVIATGLSGVLGVYFIARLGRNATPQQVLRATGWALLVVAWLGAAVYPWYLVWGIALVGLTGALKMHKPLLIAVVVVSFLIMPGGYGTLDPWGDWRRIPMAFLTLFVMCWALYRVLKINDIQMVRGLRRLTQRAKMFTQRGLTVSQ